MSIIIDLIVVGLIALSTFLGYKKGLIGVAFKILSFLIAIVITLILYRPIAGFIINNTPIAKNIESTIIEKLSSSKIEEGQIQKESTDLPNVVVNYINSEITKTVNNTKDEIVVNVAKDLSENIVNIGVMIALFIVIRIALIFAKVLLEAVAELPIVKQFNEAGGTIYGILRGVLLVYLILAIISLILPMTDKTSVLGIINNTILTKLLYNNNLILMIFF